MINMRITNPCILCDGVHVVFNDDENIVSCLTCKSNYRITTEETIQDIERNWDNFNNPEYTIALIDKQLAILSSELNRLNKLRVTFTSAQARRLKVEEELDSEIKSALGGKNENKLDGSN